MKFFVINLNKYFYTFVFILFTISLLLFSNNNYIAAKDGLFIFTTSVFPTLFPFFIATELLAESNFTFIASKLLDKPIKKLFNLPGCSSLAIILGSISGYPIGAKIVASLKSKNQISKVDAEKLITFTNNSGPFFILGTIGLILFNNIKIGIILLISHLLSSLTVGIIFKNYKQDFPKYNYYNQFSTNNIKLIRTKDIGEILSNSIKKSISSILLVGGYIILFSVILSILNDLKLLDFIASIFSIINIPTELSKSIICGLIEITNGLNMLSTTSCNTNTKLILSSFILGFGGLSIFFQIYSIISKEKISIRPYLYGKILQAIISAFYTFILIMNFPVF